MSRAPITMTVRGGRFTPMDPYAEEQVASLPDGDYNVRVSKLTRLGREERDGLRGLWWGGLTVLADNTEDWRFNEKRKAHDSIMIAIGYSRPRFRIDGKFDMIPISTSDESMDDDEFRVVMERGETYIIQQLGWSPWEQWKAEHPSPGYA